MNNDFRAPYTKFNSVRDNILMDQTVENIAFQLRRIEPVNAVAFDDGQWFQDVVMDVYALGDMLTCKALRKILSRFIIEDSLIT